MYRNLLLHIVYNFFTIDLDVLVVTSLKVFIVFDGECFEVPKHLLLVLFPLLTIALELGPAGTHNGISGTSKKQLACISSSAFSRFMQVGSARVPLLKQILRFN